MTPVPGARLFFHRLGRLAHDTTGGGGRADRRGAAWAARWAGRHGSITEWLRRPGAGRLWIAPEEAAKWARTTCEPEDIALARAAAEGCLPLLSSATQPAGACWQWRRDLYSGYEWPLEPSHRIRLQRDDGSDIRTVWELSRCYHFIALARAWWTTGDARYRDAFVRNVDSWISDNPVGMGPHWTSPMDVAVRSANWAMAIVLFAPDPEIPSAFWQRMLANLFASGLFLERHLEWHPVHRGNHYVADAVGLAYLGALFQGDPAGDRWLGCAGRILPAEFGRQVGPDGVSFESSLAYHRLVTELLAFGGEVLRLNAAEGWSDEYADRLRAMYRFISAYLPDSGEAPQLGDADDGRLHAVSARGWLEPRRHALGLPDEFWSTAPGDGAFAFPEGGFYVLRNGSDHAVIRCGPVGLNGAGSHDHNDQLSLELVLQGRRIVADSGTYAYTRDLDARLAFRSTVAHSVLQIAREEQNPIRRDRPWRVLADRTHARATGCAAGPGELRFEGEHTGFAQRTSAAICRRTVVADLATGEWEIVDRIEGAGQEPVTWRLHLAPTAVEQSLLLPGRYRFLLPGLPMLTLELSVPDGMSVRVESSWMSERYGTRVMRPCIVASGTLSLPTTISATFRPDVG